MVYEFCSTSKVTFAGGGISALAASKANLDDVKRTMTIQTIGHDKVNQLRHARYFKDVNGVYEHMKKHAAILRPKFEAVINEFEKELSGLGIASWVKPKGGYFISFETMDGCATYPYKKDPNDSNIRIAPSLPTEEELKQATELFILCVKLVSVDKLLETA